MSFNVDAFVANARFSATKFREGYDPDAVNGFLNQVSQTVKSGTPQEIAKLPENILQARFELVRFKEGYDMVEVDDFLDDLMIRVRAFAGTSGSISGEPGSFGTAGTPIFDESPTQFGGSLQAEDQFSQQAQRFTSHVGFASTHPAQPTQPSKLAGLIPYLTVDFPDSESRDGYSKRDVDNFVEFLQHATASNSSYTPEEVLRAAEHASPGSSGLFSKGYDRQAVDAFNQRVVNFLKTL